MKEKDGETSVVEVGVGGMHWGWGGWMDGWDLVDEEEECAGCGWMRDDLGWVHLSIHVVAEVPSISFCLSHSRSSFIRFVISVLLLPVRLPFRCGCNDTFKEGCSVEYRGGTW